MGVSKYGVPAMVTVAFEEPLTSGEAYGSYYVAQVGYGPRHRVFIATDFANNAPQTTQSFLNGAWTSDGLYFVTSYLSGGYIYNSSGTLLGRSNILWAGPYATHFSLTYMSENKYRVLTIGNGLMFSQSQEYIFEINPSTGEGSYSKYRAYNNVSAGTRAFYTTAWDDTRRTYT